MLIVIINSNNNYNISNLKALSKTVFLVHNFFLLKMEVNTDIFMVVANMSDLVVPVPVKSCSVPKTMADTYNYHLTVISVIRQL